MLTDLDTVKSYLLDAALYVLKVVRAFEPTYDPVTKTLYGSTSALIPKYDHSKSIGQQLFESLRCAGTKVTQINADTGVTTTADEVLVRSIRVAQNLKKINVDIGDIVAICVANTDNVYPLLFGLIMSQVVINTLDPNFKMYEIKHMLRITLPKLIFCDAENYSSVRTCLDDLNLDTVVITLGEQVTDVRHINSLLQSTGQESQFSPVVKIDYENDVAFILCSSGTTGLCKAICLSQKSMLSSTKPPPVGVFFNFGSLYWMSGIGSTIFTTISGITRVFTKRSFDPDMFIDVIAKYKVTDYFGAPAYMALLSKHPRLKTADLSSLKNMIIGGAAFPDHYKREVEKYWPGRQFKIAYGMSELGGIGCLSFFDYKPGCAGKPLMNYRVRVCDDEGKVLALNQVGEIYLSSNCKFLGYYGDEVSTLETMAAEGFLKTGDLGYLDEDGFVFVVGRKKEMMKYANVAISPLELENLLSQHPEILDCCIVGIPDVIYESLVTALVVRIVGSTITEPEITDYFNNQVQDAKHLRGGVYFVEEIPLTKSGKPQRFAAQKIAIDLRNQKINVKSKI